MKKHLLFGLFACLALNSISQNQTLVKNALVPASSSSIENLIKSSLDIANAPKTLLCQDTIRYPQIKEQLLNASATFFNFTLWTDDAEYMSQTYLHTGGTITIPKIEFFGNKNTLGAASIIVEGSIYNVNASNVPTTLISSGTMTLTSTTAGYNYVTLSSPAVVTGNYAVVIRPTTANGRLDLFVNNALAGQIQDEGLSKVRSIYYPQSLGNWVSVPVLTNDAVNFTNVLDFEALISPIISYTINTVATAVTSPACLGTAVQYNNSTTPTGILSSRMYNYQRFNLYFGVATADSSFAWDMDNLSPIIWSNTTNYTHPAAGTYDVTLFTLGGFWSSCTDNGVVQVLINPAGNANFTYPSSSFCLGAANPTPTAMQTGPFTATPAGLNFINTTTGQINLATSALGTYLITHTIPGLCTSTATQTITINPSPNSNFTYSGSTFCTGSSNQTPTINDPGTFSASPAGLLFVSATTGEIDMAASADNTYVISYTTIGACASTSTQNVTITNTPIGGFSYSQSSYCLNDVNQSPIFGAGASGGVFTATPVGGMSIAANGQINIAASVAGFYTVTNTISGSGCPVVIETTTIILDVAPVVSMTPLSDVCASVVPFSLMGGTPAMGTYSGTGVNAGMFSPAAAMAGVHPITYTFIDVNNCQASATESIIVNALPTVTMGTFPNTFCAGDAAVALPAVSPVGGTYSGNGVSGMSFDPTISGIGTFPITYMYQNTEGCEASATQSAVVNATPNVTLSALSGTCANYAPFALSGGSPAGGSFSGPGVAAGGMFDPSIAGLGTHTINYSFTAGGCSGTATQTLTVDGCASITEIDGVNALIYPNPANNELNIIINNGNVEELSISLISTDGKQVLSRTSNQQNINIQLNVSDFSAGVYYVSVNSDSGKMIRKVVIQ